MGSFGNGDEIRHTSNDYDSREGWLRHCHEGCELPFDAGEGHRGISGPGFYAGLVGGMYGHTRRQFQRVFEGWGESSGISAPALYRNLRALAVMHCVYGKPANTTIDINLATLGFEDDHRIASIFQKFRDGNRRWLARRNVPDLHIWNLERGQSGRGPLHLHMLAYVPPELSIKRLTDLNGETPYRAHAEAMLEAFIGRALLKAPQSRTIRVRHRSEPRADHQWSALFYRSKGSALSQEEASRRFGLHRVCDQGRIPFKRTGVSRLLDDKMFEELRAMNNLPAFDFDAPGNRPYDDRYMVWHREHGDELILPVTTLNGNRRGCGFVFGPASGVEPLDVEDAAKNGRVSRAPAEETDWRLLNS